MLALDNQHHYIVLSTFVIFKSLHTHKHKFVDPILHTVDPEIYSQQATPESPIHPGKRLIWGLLETIFYIPSKLENSRVLIFYSVSSTSTQFINYYIHHGNSVKDVQTVLS